MFRVGLNLYLCVYKCVTWKMFNDRVKPSKLNWGTCGSATQTLGGVHASVFLWACIASCSFILSYNVGPSVSCPLTVLVCKENFGVVCWYELQQQVFRICDNQWAAVLQYRSAQVRIYCWVHTASLRPEGRQEKKKRIGNVHMNKWMVIRQSCCCQCPAGLTVQSGCVHMPAGR